MKHDAGATLVEPRVLRLAHMESVGVREVRQNASVYLRRVAAGEQICVTDRGRPVALLVGTADALRETTGALIGLLVEAGLYPDIDAALAAGVEALTADLRRRLVDQAIVEGYTRVPQEVDPWFEAASRRASDDLEPW